MHYDFTHTHGEIVRIYHVERDPSFDLLERALHNLAPGDIRIGGLTTPVRPSRFGPAAERIEF